MCKAEVQEKMIDERENKRRRRSGDGEGEGEGEVGGWREKFRKLFESEVIRFGADIGIVFYSALRSLPRQCR